jgi:large subunit ribosomal protein L6
MSRIGKLPVNVPNGVTVTVNGTTVTVKGPKGILVQEFNKDITVKIEDGKVIVTRPSDDKEHRALHGLTRALIANMVKGVTEGYEKSLEINGVGYRAAKTGKKLNLTLGYSHPVDVEEISGITFEVPAPNKIVVKGIDKQLVGQVAAQVRELRPPEPYKGKGIKYEDEVIRRKEGKTGKGKKK